MSRQRTVTPRVVTAWSLAAALFLSLAIPGVKVAAKQVKSSVQSYPLSNTIPTEIERAAEYIHNQLPPNSPVLLVVGKRDGWVDGLWHRALYPTAVFLCYQRDLDTSAARDLRVRQHIRF